MLFRAFDLRIRSPILLPGLVPWDGDTAGQADVDITVFPSADGAADEAPLYALENAALHFAPPGVAHYRITARSIAIQPFAEADPEDVIALTLSTALPALLWMRGSLVLHATGIAATDGSGALLIAGPSGVGKSTVTAQFVTEGMGLLADDSVRVVPSSAGGVASGLAGGYHLTEADGETRRFVPADHPVDRSVVKAILILSRTDGDAEVTRLDPVAAVARLLAQRHRPKVPALLGLDAEMLAICAELTRTVPIFAWRRSTVMLSGWEREAVLKCLA